MNAPAPNNQPLGPDAIVRIDVTGKNPARWAECREKLMQKIHELLQTTLDHQRGTTVGQEAQQLTTALLDYAKAKLAMPGLEAEKMVAEVAKIHAEKSKELAEANKLNAEADEIRSRRHMRELCTSLCLMKMSLIGEQGEEAILLGQQIDGFVLLVKELSLMQSQG